jgi:hypothetical protein
MNARRTLLHAARLLERDAESLRVSHSVNGEWQLACGCDVGAKHDHDDMLATAVGLRALARWLHRAVAETDSCRPDWCGVKDRA